MTRSPVVAAVCASLLLQGCTHVRGYQQGAASAEEAGTDVEGPTAPTAPTGCSIAPSVVGGVAKGLLIPLIICVAGGPVTLFLCGAALEEAAGVAIGIFLGSMALGGLIGAAEGASRCAATGAVAEPEAPEPAPPSAAEPTSPDPSAREP